MKHSSHRSDFQTKQLSVGQHTKSVWQTWPCWEICIEKSFTFQWNSQSFLLKWLDFTCEICRRTVNVTKLLESLYIKTVSENLHLSILLLYSTPARAICIQTDTLIVVPHYDVVHLVQNNPTFKNMSPKKDAFLLLNAITLLLCKYALRKASEQDHVNPKPAYLCRSSRLGQLLDWWVVEAIYWLA